MGSQAQQAQSVPMASSTALLNASFPSLGRGLSSGFGSLARQSSIYSLTLDEFQSSIPEVKNFGSMNMDEFLKNIWTAEEQQAMAALMTTASTGAEVQQPPPATEGLTRQPSLQRQGSLTLPRTLSRKTVDEVWRDIHASNDGANTATTAQQQRTTTFGEMTLEDFLVRAGVVRDDLDSVGNSLVPVSGGFPPPPPAGGENVGDRVDLAAGFADREGTAGAERDMGAGIHPGLTLSPANAMEAMQVDAFKQQQQQVQVQWLSDQFRTAQQQQALLAQQQVEAAAYVNAAKRMGNGGPVGLGPLGGGLANSMAGGLGIGLGAGAGMSTLALAPASPTSPISDGMGNGGNGLSLSPIGGGYGLDGLRGRKRGPDGPVEKVVERRQRRMIKNRESAARSRARKQAYTVELEAEVTQLKEENMRLRKLQEEEMKKKQMIEAMVARGQQSAPQSRVMALRRTRSGPWCYQFSRGGGI